MATLFTTYEVDLKQLFDVLPEEEIKECCSSQVYYRGVDYFEKGYVHSAELTSDKTILTAKVKGSQVYAVQVSLKNGKVETACTCPQDTVCKHIVATMLYATVENVYTQSATAKTSLDIRKYLNSQPKEYLVDLLIKYGSDELFTMISNKHLSTSDAQKILNKAKRSLDDMFNDGQLSNDPDAFEGSLMNVIKTLSGLETKMPRKLGELIVLILGKVEKATDEGYLYDHYRDYHFEPSEQFYQFVAGLANAMDLNEKTEFIEQFEAAIRNSSYTTFHDGYKWLGKCFTDSELPQLKNLLVNEYNDLPEAVVESYYSRVSSMLSDNEKEKVLELLAGRNDSRATELAELLNKTGKRKKSILMLRQLIFGDADALADERLCLLYLDQMQAEELDLRDAVMNCMKQCPTERMLRKVTELLPSERSACEEILETQRPEELLNYLESMGRAVDALSLIKRAKNIWHDRVFTFYKKNKRKFPKEARKYFSDTITENLKNTGDHYYHTIADALNHLKQVDKDCVHEWALHLRQHYKRRIKLMALLENI